MIETIRAQVGFMPDVYLEKRIFDDETHKQKDMWKWSVVLCQIEARCQGVDLKLPAPATGHPLLSVLYNQLIRGTPTRLPYSLEQSLVPLGFTTAPGENARDLKHGASHKFADLSDEVHAQIFNPITGEVASLDEAQYQEQYNRPGNDYDSRWEARFLLEALPTVLGPLTTIWVQPQALLKDLLTIQQRPFKEAVEFEGMRVDFYIPLTMEPAEGQVPGIVIELDGPHHLENEQKALDDKRDAALRKENYLVYRLPWETHNSNEALRNFCLSIKSVLKSSPAWQALQIRLTQDDLPCLPDLQKFVFRPQVMARAQWAVLRYLLANPERLNGPIRIAVVEHDYSGSAQALKELIEQWNNLVALTGSAQRLDIQFKVIHTGKDGEQSLRPGVFREKDFDLVISLSVEYSPTIKHIEAETPLITIYTLIAGIPASRDPLAFAPPLRYQSLGEYTEGNNFVVPEDRQSRQHALEYFLRNIFRKPRFRDGQLAILNSSLARKNVIGLLPTGGGKSLTYQLTALLQPGVCIVVAPLRSLMYDQWLNLKRNGIDSAAYLNSMQSSTEKRFTMDSTESGYVHILLVSPERIQIPRMQAVLTNMGKANYWFSTAVIDEAHCVSEWGHDFRPAYLSLGDNMRRLLPNYQSTVTDGNEVEVPILALTATASFDVLTDIRRELAGKDGSLSEQDVVRPAHENEDRKELHYRIVSTAMQPTDYTQVAPILDLSLMTILNSVGKELARCARAEMANSPAAKMPSPFKPSDLLLADEKGRYPYGILVFVPHARGDKGVTKQFDPKSPNGMLERLQLEGFNPVGYRGSGASSNQDAQKAVDDWSLSNQRKFVTNEAGLMVATKAFGMGIDKPNIRTTIHYVPSGSIEGFVQEAGRAARDGYLGLSYVIFCDHEYKTKSGDIKTVASEVHDFFHNGNFEGQEKDLEPILALFDGFAVYRDLLASYAENWIHKEVGDYEYTFKYWERENLKRYYLNHPHLNDEKIFFDLSVKVRPNMGPNSEMLQIVQSAFAAAFRAVPSTQRQRILEHREGLLAMLEKDSRRMVIPFDLLANGAPFPLASLNKAIYRLSTLGVIRHFTVDYQFRQFTLELNQLSHELGETGTAAPANSYLKCFEEYLGRYESPARVKTYIDEVREAAAEKPASLENTLKTLAQHLLKYTYSTIAKKRKQALDDMISALREGTDPAEGPQRFKDFINVYFRSKYARRDFQIDGQPFSLTDDLETQLSDVAIIEKYSRVLSAEANYVDNASHLRGACMRLLRDRPFRPCLHLLKMYALVALAVSEQDIVRRRRNIDEAKEAVKNGVEQTQMLDKRWSLGTLRDLLQRLLADVKDNCGNDDASTRILKDFTHQIDEQVVISYLPLQLKETIHILTA